MDKEEAIERLNQQLQRVPELKKLNYVADDGKDEDNIQKLNLWIDKCRIIIKEGLDPDDLKEFASWRGGHCKGFEEQEDYTGKLTDYETALKSIIQKYEILGIEEKSDCIEVSPEDVLRVVSPKEFIAHGGKSGVLDKLRDFIHALGIDPLIVELLPSKGMSVDDKVNKYIKDADCGIVLATKEGIIDKKSRKQHPRLNVIDEFERLRAVFPDKTILLLEKGVDLPSNIAGLTYEPFARQSMDRAFTAIARELTAFGILKAVKPQKE